MEAPAALFPILFDERGVAEYAQDMYGDRLSGALQQGLGTDRFIVKWDLGASAV